MYESKRKTRQVQLVIAVLGLFMLQACNIEMTDIDIAIGERDKVGKKREWDICIKCNKKRWTGYKRGNKCLVIMNAKLKPEISKKGIYGNREVLNIKNDGAFCDTYNIYNHFAIWSALEASDFEYIDVEVEWNHYSYKQRVVPRKR